MAQHTVEEPGTRSVRAVAGREDGEGLGEEFELPGYLARIEPPYDQVVLYPDPRRFAPEALPFGSLVGLSVFPGAEDRPGLEGIVRALRARVPFAPLLLRLEGRSRPAGPLPFTGGLTALGLGAVLYDDDHPVEALRPQLTAPASPADDILRWLGHCGVRVPPPVVGPLREVLVRGALVGEVVAWEERLPPPERWASMVRALHAALRLQAEPCRTLRSVAAELGYTDQFSLCQRIWDSFQVMPSLARRVLGWEWLVYRWLRSELRSDV